MKIFNLILLINILKPCIISILDEENNSCVCGYIQILKGSSYYENKNVFFSDKHKILIESTTGGCKHLCSEYGHKMFSGFLKRFKSIENSSSMYCVCVRNIEGTHVFDLVIIKDLNDMKNEMYTFVGEKCCISKNKVILENECCCSCDGSGFIQMIAIHEVSKMK